MRMIQVSKFDQGHCIWVIFNCEFCLMEMLEQWLLFFFAHYIFVATYVKVMNGSECVEILSKAIPLGAIV